MKYINATDRLLKEIQTYVRGDLLYIPNDLRNKKWGEKSGARDYYLKRNNDIKNQYKSEKHLHRYAMNMD